MPVFHRIIFSSIKMYSMQWQKKNRFMRSHTRTCLERTEHTYDSYMYRTRVHVIPSLDFLMDNQVSYIHWVYRLFWYKSYYYQSNTIMCKHNMIYTRRVYKLNVYVIPSLIHHTHTHTRQTNRPENICQDATPLGISGAWWSAPLNPSLH